MTPDAADVPATPDPEHTATAPGPAQIDTGTDAEADTAEALCAYARTDGRRFLADPNITSIGVGRKVVDGRRVGPLCLQFTVRTKVRPETLGDGRIVIPPILTVDGVEVPTDVLERDYRLAAQPAYANTADTADTADMADTADTADMADTADPADTVRPAAPAPGTGPALRPGAVPIPEAAGPDRTRRQDPLVPGVSVAHVDGTAGTVGCIVVDRRTADRYVLSNCHVLQGVDGQAGDAVVQPGPADGGTAPADRIGDLVRGHLGLLGDCAVAGVGGRRVDPRILGLGVVPRRAAAPALDQTVVKSGRTTGVTRGTVRRVGVVVKLDYGDGEHQVGVVEIAPVKDAHPAAEISDAGDSGAVWLASRPDGSATDTLVALHVAGEADGPDEHALACPAPDVLDVLDVTLPAEDPEIAGSRARRRIGGGYDPGFLGQDVPAPALAETVRADAAVLDGSPQVDYTHFSLSMSRSRRLARWVAWNVDGGGRLRLSRSALRFRLDPRLPADVQTGAEVYAANRLARGHLARRSDLLWGPRDEAARANSDSFYFTNIAPQIEDFNQASQDGLWGRLEDALYAEVDVDALRVSVLAGPVLGSDDVPYREALVPREFWKVIVFAEGGILHARGFLLTQRLTRLEDLGREGRLELEPFRTWQVTLADLEERTGVVFPPVLHDADLPADAETAGVKERPGRAGAGEHPGTTRPAGVPTERAPLRSPADIRW